MSKRLVVGLGEALWDLLPEGKQLGGAPANYAFHAQQMGHESVAVSAIGNDALGEETVRALEDKGLQYLMPQVDLPTGTVQVKLDAEGVPLYDIVQPVAWDHIPLTEEMLQVARQAKAVCWGSLAQRNEISRQSIQHFIEATPPDCLRIFDINLRQHFYTREIIHNSLMWCNILKINDEELVTLGALFDCLDLNLEERCRFLMERFKLDLLVLTCGVNGSYVFTPDKMLYQETPKLEVADTVGAGDSFTGTFCASLLEGRSVEEAHRRAVKVSAYVCTQQGAMPLIPASLKAL